MDIQTYLAAEDFRDPRHAQIAGVYWDHQRHEGEPVFNEFLGVLGGLKDPSLTELAVELVEEIESLRQPETGFEETLKAALGYFGQVGHHRDQQKLLAELRRTSDEKVTGEKLTAQNELSLFEAIVKNNQSTNLRRLGPVKRSGS